MMSQGNAKNLGEDYNHWYEETCPQLTNYGMWLRGHEINTLPLKECKSRSFKVLFVRLSTYNDVTPSFTHLLLYQLAADIPGIFPDIAYLPPENDVKIFEKYNVPWLLGTQTKFGPKHFSLIGFSNSIVQEIINIPKFLATSGIPLKRSERLEREDIPLIILGGANAPYTTSIWGKDGLVDGVFIGCNPSYIKRLLITCADGFKNKKSKPQILAELATIPGFYRTDKPEQATKEEKYQAGDIEVLEKGIVPYSDEAIGSGYLQISEGCRAMCSFCAESWTRKPYREVDIAPLLEKALRMKKNMGIEKLNIFSFNFNMHSRFYKLLWELAPFFHSIGLKSQRFDMLSNDVRMVECQHAAGKTTFSAGLEGISPRLRRYLNKNLTEDALYKSLEFIFKIKAREIKIFLLSTGIENDNDFREFKKLLDVIEKKKKEYNAHTCVIFSITPLVKFPWTPLEFDDAYPVKAHSDVIAKMRQAVTTHHFKVRQAMDEKEYLISQILTRSSDERILKALLGALQETGFVYYIHISAQFFKSFVVHLEKEGIKIENALKGFSYEESLGKSWAAFEMGVKKEFLWGIHQKNICFTEVGTTLDKVKLETPPFGPQEYRERFHQASASEVEVAFSIKISNLGCGILRKYIGVALGRALMKAEEALVRHFRHYVSSHWAGDETKPVWITGDDIVTLAWDRQALSIFEERCTDAKFISVVNTHFADWGIFKGLKKEEDKSFRLHIDSPYEFNGTAYFKRKGIKFTLYKNSHNSYSLRFTDESLKKDIIRKCSYVVNKDVDVNAAPFASMDIVPGRKFNPEEFVREAFVCPNKNDWARIHISSTMT